jgi:hypothetical protein
LSGVRLSLPKPAQLAAHKLIPVVMTSSAWHSHVAEDVPITSPLRVSRIPVPLLALSWHSGNLVDISFCVCATLHKGN